MSDSTPDARPILTEAERYIDALERTSTVQNMRIPDEDFTTDRAFVVWRFDEAPLWLQGCSDFGGDEEWLIYVPATVPITGETGDAAARLAKSDVLPYARDARLYSIPEGLVWVLAH